MLKVVFDTNVIISAALYAESLSALLLSLGLEDKVRFFVSPALQGALHHVTVFLWQRLTNTLLPLPASMSFKHIKHYFSLHQRPHFLLLSIFILSPLYLILYFWYNLPNLL
jgi:predicted nucleic acid-binding protein